MKNRTLLLVGLTLIFFQTACKDDAPLFPGINGGDYFPLQVGNRWTYTLTYPSGTYILEHEIVGTAAIGAHDYFVFRRTFDLAVQDDTTYYRSDGSGRVFINWQGQEALYIDFNRGAGESWESYGEYIASINKKNFRSDVPTGRFQDCIEVFFDYPPAIDDELWQVYAPGVGLIEIRGFIGVIQLQSAVVNRVEID
jgi:hypothetical protein